MLAGVDVALVGVVGGVVRDRSCLTQKLGFSQVYIEHSHSCNQCIGKYVPNKESLEREGRKTLIDFL